MFNETDYKINMRVLFGDRKIAINQRLQFLETNN